MFIINEPESCYLSYHSTAGRRLSLPRHCSKGVTKPVPKGNLVCIISSTPTSRPNTVGLKCPSARPYVRPSVRPQKVSSISMTFGM